MGVLSAIERSLKNANSLVARSPCLPNTRPACMLALYAWRLLILSFRLPTSLKNNVSKYTLKSLPMAI